MTAVPGNSRRTNRKSVSKNRLTCLFPTYLEQILRIISNIKGRACSTSLDVAVGLSSDRLQHLAVNKRNDLPSCNQFDEVAKEEEIWLYRKQTNGDKEINVAWNCCQSKINYILINVHTGCRSAITEGSASAASKSIEDAVLVHKSLRNRQVTDQGILLLLLWRISDKALIVSFSYGNLRDSEGSIWRTDS